MNIAFPPKNFDVPTIRPVDGGFDVYYRDGTVEHYDRSECESYSGYRCGDIVNDIGA
jgi:hypothetical protein